MKTKVLLILLISIVFGFISGYSLHHLIHKQQVEENITLLPEHPYYLLEEINEEILFKTLKHFGYDNPATITAQAVLETGNFKSRLCLEKNNLFGLYNSRKHEYFEFDSWISCVFAYKKMIYSRYNPEKEDYWQFLERIGYAEDPNYVAKVKTLRTKILQKYDKH